MIPKDSKNKHTAGLGSPSPDCYTVFYDMSSGGSEKENFTKLAVRLPEREAVEWFEKTFGRDPHYVTCQCCGADYAVYERIDTDHADVVVDDPSVYNKQEHKPGQGLE